MASCQEADALLHHPSSSLSFISAPSLVCPFTGGRPRTVRHGQSLPEVSCHSLTLVVAVAVVV
eukprot:584880-Hanusia_phi.AAC.1